MITIQPINCKNLKSDKINIQHHQYHLKQNILKQVAHSVPEFEWRIHDLLQREKDYNQSDDDIIGVNFQEVG